MDSMIRYMNPSAVLLYRGDLSGRSLKNCHSPKSNEKIERVLGWFATDDDNNRFFLYHNGKDNIDMYMIALRDADNCLIGFYEKWEFRNLEV